MASSGAAGFLSLAQRIDRQHTMPNVGQTAPQNSQLHEPINYALALPLPKFYQAAQH